MSSPSQQPSLIQARAAQMHAVARFPLDAEAFVRVRDRLAAYCGVYLDTTRQHVLEHALAYRMAATRSDFATYERRLRLEREEVRRLSELVVNHETYFFRNQPHTRALRDVLLPELHRRKPKGEPIRLWSAGCATGEEAYSLAITALEALPLGNRPIEVWATDLSDAALATARTGLYAGRALMNVEPATLRQFFEPAGPAFRVRERVRDLVRFEHVNLLEPLPPMLRNIDIVFCQNVIIYFELATSQAFLHNMYELLPEGAMLCLGFSETLWNIFDRFHTREVLGAYVYYKETFVPERIAAPSANLLPAARAAKLQVRSGTRPLGVPVPPPSDATLLEQGRELLAQNMVDQAIDQLQQVAPDSPCAAEALVLVAHAYADRGQIDRALHAASQAVERDSLHEQAALLLGVLHGRRGEWLLAIRQLERARYLNNGSPIVSFQLAEAYRSVGRVEAAHREYRTTLVKLQPYPPDTLLDGVSVGWLRETCQRHLPQM